jgi:K+-sensing histidine kinase KdpD
LILTVRSACQLVTAAAHADDPQFGAQLLQSTSHDLRSFLDRTIAKLGTPGVGR